MQIFMREHLDIHHLNQENEQSSSSLPATQEQGHSINKMTLLIKRIYDVILSAIGLIVLAPFFVAIAILIKTDSPGPVFFKQARVGKDEVNFNIYKFRKMHKDTGDNGLKLTISNDSRMTNFGKFMRKYKIDELPQIWNVLIGDMSFVGPRPETPNYVALYNENQKEILKIKPGITDYASLEFFDEGDLLEEATDPEKFYIETLIPLKVKYNLKYMSEMSIKTDLKIILLTIWRTIKQVGGKNESSNISRG